MGSETAEDTAPISKLGDDLLEEILIRLPNPRFNSRCKPVCKRWNSLISNPCFNRRFVSYHQSKHKSEALILPSDKPLSSILNFLPVPVEIRYIFVIWDSYEDLLLCGFQESLLDVTSELGRSFLVCNPFTKQWVALPLAPAKPRSSYRITRVKLVCDVNSLDLGDGRVFKHSNHRFRVLVGYKGVSELHVFCSESREWSTRKDLLLQPDAVSLNGKLYWMNTSGELVEWNPFRLGIPATAIDSKGIFNRSRLRRLSVSDVALYVSLVPVCQRDVMRVWRWEEGNMTWTICNETKLKMPKTVKRNYGRDIENVEVVSIFAQHVLKPEVYFLKCSCDENNNYVAVFSLNFKTQELEIVTGIELYGGIDRWKDRLQLDRVRHRWMVFQPRIYCFSTPIPSYERLLGMYDGSYGGLAHNGTST